MMCLISLNQATTSTMLRCQNHGLYGARPIIWRMLEGSGPTTSSPWTRVFHLNTCLHFPALSSWTATTGYAVHWFLDDIWLPAMPCRKKGFSLGGPSHVVDSEDSWQRFIKTSVRRSDQGGGGRSLSSFILLLVFTNSALPDTLSDLLSFHFHLTLTRHPFTYAYVCITCTYIIADDQSNEVRSNKNLNAARQYTRGYNWVRCYSTVIPFQLSITNTFNQESKIQQAHWMANTLPHVSVYQEALLKTLLQDFLLLSVQLPSDYYIKSSLNLNRHRWTAARSSIAVASSSVIGSCLVTKSKVTW